jgi:hypothetical protein
MKKRFTRKRTPILPGRANGNVKPDDLSVFDLMGDQIGIIETGVVDLASNPKHLEGFGR